MNTALLRLPERGILFLADLCNACLRLTYFPEKRDRDTEAGKEFFSRGEPQTHQPPVRDVKVSE